MSGVASESPGRLPVALVIGAQILLLVGIGLYAFKSDWTASSNGLFTVLGGTFFVVAGSLVWWRWGSRAPLALTDIWLGLYGALALGLVGDVGEGTPFDPTGLILGLLWTIGGFGGAIAVWRARR